jgi:hypothetical protein
MESITFSGIPGSYAKTMVSVFNLIAEGKRNGEISEEALRVLLGDLYETKFISTKAEADFWLEKWRVAPSIDVPWDFGSWVDAFLNADIDFKELKLFANGSGEITFEQLSCPSGGIEATEQIVKVFGGNVVSNNAI